MRVMDDEEWRAASLDEKLDGLRTCLKALIEHVDGPLRASFTELVARVDALKRPQAVMPTDIPPE
jgi:hypothetical protein